MPRPKKPRFVSGYPLLEAFVPQGIPLTGEVILTVEELESIRLSDFEGMDIFSVELLEILQYVCGLKTGSAVP